MAELKRDGLIEAAKSARAGAQGPLSRLAFERMTGISQYNIYPRLLRLRRVSGFAGAPGAFGVFGRKSMGKRMGRRLAFAG